MKRSTPEVDESLPLSEVPLITPVTGVQDFSRFDALIVVSSSLQEESFPGKDVVMEHKRLDKQVGEGLTIHVTQQAPNSILIVSPTGPTNRDYDDVRCWIDAARAGIFRAKLAGSTKPILMIPSTPNLQLSPGYSHVMQASLLGALQEIYQPLQAREHLGRAKVEPITEIGFYAPWLSVTSLSEIPPIIHAMEAGKRLARDLAEGDPEYMGPVRFTEHVIKAFEHVKNVKISVISNITELEKDYPLLSAVARASQQVDRHRPRVIRLEYVGEGEIEETLMLAGKGVTYDSGGADVKIQNAMAGMSRDKCGASNIAGFVLTTALLKPRALRVVAMLGVVRNSIGPFGYVSDEIITGHAGIRVKVIDTDCEGRMVLADCLSHLRCEALNAKNPQIMSMATLTYHVMKSIGPYVAIVPNGPSRLECLPQKIQSNGAIWGDLFEISSLTREDFRILKKDSSVFSSFDVLQEDPKAGRAHQFAAAFLIMASGLDKHGRDSKVAIPYCHLDIAGAACENIDYVFGKTTACTLVALTATYVLPRITIK